MFPRESAEQDRRLLTLLACEGSGTVCLIVLYRRRARISMQVAIDSYQLSHVVGSSDESFPLLQDAECVHCSCPRTASVSSHFSFSVLRRRSLWASYLFFDLPLASPR